MPKKYLGDLIKEYREKLVPKMSGKDFAKKVKIDPTYLTYIEKHGKLPSLKVMKRIATEITKLEAEYFFLLERYLAEKYPEVDEVQKEIFEYHRINDEMVNNIISHDRDTK